MKYKSLKKEYRKLLRISNTQLKAELKKPGSEQDMQLIDECLESIAFCEKELSELGREGASARGFSLGALGRAGVALLVLIVSFAAFAAVSEAAGFRVWTAIIKRDAGYLRVDYVPEPTSAPVEVYKGWDDGEYSFFSKWDFDSRIEKDGLTPFAVENDDYRFVEGSVRSTPKDYYATYTLRNGSCTVRVRMIAKANDPSPVSVWGMNEKFAYYELTVKGIKAAYQTDDLGRVFATWQSGGRIFSASVFEPRGEAADIVSMIVR